MKLPNAFKIVWWVLILVTVSVILVIRFDNITSGSYTLADTFIFLLWIMLILFPIFNEINFFGLKVKKELEDLKDSVQQLQISSLTSMINNRVALNQTVNIADPTTAIPSQTENLAESPDASAFNLMDKKILSTLWKYQRIHFGDNKDKRWTFMVHPFAPEYPEYLKSLAKLIGFGLVAVNPENHHCMFTNQGIEFVKHHIDLQTEDNLFIF